MPFTDFEKLMDNIRPRQKLLLIDACNSGDYSKTITNNENLTNAERLLMMSDFEIMRDQFVNIERNSGSTIIASSGSTQGSIERDELKNGVFMASILEALRTDNAYLKFYGPMKYEFIGDQLSLGNLKRYVSKRVPELSSRYQQPIIRTENLGLDWFIKE